MAGHTDAPDTSVISPPDGLSAADALGLTEKPGDVLNSLATGTPTDPPKLVDDINTPTAPAVPEKPERPEGDPTAPSKEPEGDPPKEPTEGDPPAKPAEPATPPAEPAKPAEPPTEPDDPDIVTIGDKKFRRTELAAVLERDRIMQAQREEEARKTAAATPTEPEPPKGPSEEEVKKMEQTFIAETVEKLGGRISVTEAEMDAMIEGGPEAATTLKNVLARTQATAILETRRGMYDELNSYISGLEARINPLIEQQAQLQRATVENVFVSTFPEYADNQQAMTVARQIAESMAEKYPEETQKMSHQQFAAEVDRQATQYLDSQLKVWAPQFDGGWKDFHKQMASQQPTTPTQTPPATPAPPPAPTPTPAPAKPKPPAHNSPAAPVAKGGPSTGAEGNWQSGVARSLV